MIRLILMSLALVFSSLANAAIQKEDQARYLGAGKYGPWSKTRDEACAGYAAVMGYIKHGTAPPCRLQIPGQTEIYSYEPPQYRTWCPVNSVPDGEGCKCSSGFEEKAGQCVAVNQCEAGNPATLKVQWGWGLAGGPSNLKERKFPTDDEISKVGNVCSGGCMHRFDKDHPANGGGDNDAYVYWDKNAPLGKWIPVYYYMGYKSTAQQCTEGDGSTQAGKPAPGGEPPPPKEPPDPDAPPKTPQECSVKGGYWGQVNGTPTCVQKVPASGAGDPPKPTTDDQSGNPKPPASAPAVPGNREGGSGSAGGTGGTGGGGGGSGGGTRGTGPGSGTSGPSGGASGPTGSASSPLNVTIKCQDLGTCPDANAGGGLPQRPKLWESKYPDGVTGVWNQRVGELKQAPVYQLASNMLPHVNGGTAPTWELNFDLPGVGNFGSYTLGPESWVWSACRAIVIVSALIFAFRLVFGGA